MTGGGRGYCAVPVTNYSPNQTAGLLSICLPHICTRMADPDEKILSVRNAGRGRGRGCAQKMVVGAHIEIGYMLMSSERRRKQKIMILFSPRSLMFE